MVIDQMQIKVTLDALEISSKAEIWITFLNPSFYVESCI